MKNKWIPWLHDKTNGNWQELTTIMYNIDKSRQTQNSKRERETTIENVFESMIITETKETQSVIHINIYILTKNTWGIFALSLNQIII